MFTGQTARFNVASFIRRYDYLNLRYGYNRTIIELQRKGEEFSHSLSNEGS